MTRHSIQSLGILYNDGFLIMPVTYVFHWPNLLILLNNTNIKKHYCRVKSIMYCLNGNYLLPLPSDFSMAVPENEKKRMVALLWANYRIGDWNTSIAVMSNESVTHGMKHCTAICEVHFSTSKQFAIVSLDSSSFSKTCHIYYSLAQRPLLKSYLIPVYLLYCVSLSAHTLWPLRDTVRSWFHSRMLTMNLKSCGKAPTFIRRY
jgi:hypothetical protein